MPRAGMVRLLDKLHKYHSLEFHLTAAAVAPLTSGCQNVLGATISGGEAGGGAGWLSGEEPRGWWKPAKIREKQEGTYVIHFGGKICYFN